MWTSMATWAALALSLPLATAAIANCGCQGLAKELPGRVFFPDSPEYNTSISSYFFVTAREQPTCVFEPTTADEVSKAIKALRWCPSVPIAVRSGGHSANRGWANTDSGVTIDMRRISSVTINKDDTASVGAGALWGDVYSTVVPKGLTVVGARGANIGVGGFLTGGGISFFSPERGYACDNVRAMQVVLADGSIVTASATKNQDLFRALKGGQNNFGIVTRFDVATYEQGPFFGGYVGYTDDKSAELQAAFETFKENTYDPHAEIEQSYLYYGSQKAYSCNNIMYYTKDEPYPPALSEFTDIKPTTANTLRTSNAVDFAGEVDSFQPQNQYAVYATLSFRFEKGLLGKIYAKWKQDTAAIAQKVPDVISVMTFQSIPPPLPAGSPPNSLPFGPGDTPNKDDVLLLFSLYWPTDADTRFVEDATQSLVNSVEDLTGHSVAYQYLNYAAAWQDPIGNYGPRNVRDLRATALKYDKLGFFQHRVKGGFKLYK